MGSAVDNLGHALTDAPVGLCKKDGKDYLVKKYTQLGYVYDRRTQFIHSRIVPLIVDGGMATVYKELLAASLPELSPKYTDWDKKYTRQELLQDFYNETWQSFLKELGDAWWYLRSRLQEADKNCPLLTSVQLRYVVGSGPIVSSLSADVDKKSNP
jgi:hypothetical protein